MSMLVAHDTFEAEAGRVSAGPAVGYEGASRSLSDTGRCRAACHSACTNHVHPQETTIWHTQMILSQLLTAYKIMYSL